MREITMATISISAPTQPARTARRRGVPWLTVVPLTVVLAYADGFWLISLRGAVGAVGRAQEPFVTWLRESTLLLPVYLVAVLAALALAARWFGPVLRRPRTVVATALLVVAAGTLVGVAAASAGAAYDYHLQSNALQATGSMGSMDSTGSMGPMDSTSSTSQQQATLGLQVRAVAFGSGILLLTNVLLVGWVVAMRGGRLKVTTTRP
jgi:hypothetical protein